MKKTIAVALAIGLVVGAMVAPADAKKKRKKKKPPAPAVCAPFTPNAEAADAPILVLTDANTEEAPLEHAVSLDASIGNYDPGVGMGPFASDTAWFNVQADSASERIGVYASVSFDTRRDYDLNMFHPDGSYAARSRANNTFKGTPIEENFSTDGHGSEPTDSMEKLVGIATADCAGWTMDMESWFTDGGDFTVKLWLGPIVNEPLAPGEEAPA